MMTDALAQSVHTLRPVLPHSLFGVRYSVFILKRKRISNKEHRILNDDRILLRGYLSKKNSDMLMTDALAKSVHTSRSVLHHSLFGVRYSVFNCIPN